MPGLARAHLLDISGVTSDGVAIDVRLSPSAGFEAQSAERAVLRVPAGRRSGRRRPGATRLADWRSISTGSLESGNPGATCDLQLRQAMAAAFAGTFVVYWRKTPSIQQIEVRECGAAALGIVLAHYGRWVPINELRVACGVSRDGCNASDLQRAADLFGVDLKGRRLPYRYLRSVGTPAILFWEFQHFCVLEGFRGGDFLINDPAQGHRLVREEEFARLYTGVVLTLEPRPDFARGWAAAPHSRQALAVVPGLIEACCWSPLHAGCWVRFRPWRSRSCSVHSSTAPMPVRSATRFTLWARWALRPAALFAFTWLQQHVLNRLSLRVSVEQSARLVSILLRLPREYFAQRLAGDLAARTHLVNHVTEEGSTQLTGLFVELAVSAALLAWMVYADAWLAAGVLGGGAGQLGGRCACWSVCACTRTAVSDRSRAGCSASAPCRCEGSMRFVPRAWSRRSSRGGRAIWPANSPSGSGSPSWARAIGTFPALAQAMGAAV